MNMKISPEELMEKGKNIVAQSMIIREQVEQIKKTISDLDGWKSPSKESFVNNVIPQLNNMENEDNGIIAAIKSYGDVAISHSIDVIETERALVNVINKQNA